MILPCTHTHHGPQGMGVGRHAHSLLTRKWNNPEASAPRVPGGLDPSCLLTHAMLTSLPSRSRISAPLHRLLGITSRINCLHSNSCLAPATVKEAAQRREHLARLAEHEDGKSLGPQGHHSASEFTEWQLACLSIPTPASWLGAAAAAKSLQSCLTLCNPIDGSPPGSPVPGKLQARTLEWVAISFSNA